MSVDNYYVVRRHPEGGYVILQGFESDNGFNVDLEVENDLPRFDTLSEARSVATSMFAEYDALVHPECEVPAK